MRLHASIFSYSRLLRRRRNVGPSCKQVPISTTAVKYNRIVQTPVCFILQTACNAAHAYLHDINAHAYIPLVYTHADC